jgi:cellulose synthase/poly-beta-1,6-N-acetylglucosamine synthase-like glycosyltransferase
VVPVTGLLSGAVLALGLAAAVAIALLWIVALARGLAARWRPPLRISPPEAWPTVTVIIPAWQEQGTLEGCLASHELVSYPRWDVVVVAGGDDGTLEIARAHASGRPNVTVIEQPPGGKPAALNAGVAVASGDVVVLLDADSRVKPGWLRALVAPIDRVIWATSGRPVASRDTPVTRVEELERVAAYEVRQQTVLQGSGSIAIERAALVAVGGFDPNAYADDWELDARVALRGGVRAYCHDAVVVTERPATLAEFWTNELRWRRAHLRSLGRVGGYFLGSPGVALANVYPYVASWTLFALAVATGAAAVAGATDIARSAAALLGIGAAAVAAQRLTLPIEVVAFTRDRRWLGSTPAMLALLGVTVVACLVASISMRRATLRFKGPRPMRPEVRT